MLIMRWAVMLLLLAAGVAFAYFAATGQQRYKRFGLVIIKWIAIAAPEKAAADAKDRANAEKAAERAKADEAKAAEAKAAQDELAKQLAQAEAEAKGQQAAVALVATKDSHAGDEPRMSAAEIDERTVDVHVGRLRKALVRGREKDPIRTVRGAGYSFDETFGKG